MTARTTLWTIGHGNRPLEEFLALLADSDIECLTDVRAYPASRRHPQFGREALASSLGVSGIRYVWEGPALGGRRRPGKDSPHVALRNPQFRAYADHMMTAEFRDAIDRLTSSAGAIRTAIMCAERLPWQCHRYLISDYLEAHAIRVVHLIGPAVSREHGINPIARVRDGELVYDGQTQRVIAF
jgi:uncharacterized protein (DUF488 family)